MKPVALPLVALSLAGSALAANRARRAPLEGIEPAWSPDGRRLAYVAPARGGATDLFVVDADGTHRGRLTRTGTADELAPTGRPTGSAWSSSAPARSMSCGPTRRPNGASSRAGSPAGRPADDGSPSCWTTACTRSRSREEAHGNRPPHPAGTARAPAQRRR